MKEVIAKSKFYKQERQKAQEKLEDEIIDVDEDFDEVMTALGQLPKSKQKAAKPGEGPDKEYDIKVKELGLDRRAAPADRTKTEEEIQKENEEKRQKLEQARLDRMNGMFGEDEEKGVEDLDQDFWAGDDSGDEAAFGEEIDADSEDLDNDVKLPDEATDGSSRTSIKAMPIIPCPQTHDELCQYLENFEAKEHPALVKDIIRSFQPRLAAGNKEKLGGFVGVLLRHILYVSTSYDETNSKQVGEIQNAFIAILRSMAQKYNEPLAVTCREIINEIQARFKSQRSHGLSVADLVFFTLVGYLFSTSDHYHLVVTPCNVLIGELLEQTKLNTYQNIFFCAILARISLTYQKVGKRFTPELVYFFEKSLITLLPLGPDSKQSRIFHDIRCDSSELKAPEKIDTNAIASHDLNLRQVTSQNSVPSDEEKSALLCNILASLDEAVSLIWKDLPAFPEITHTFKSILIEFSRVYPSFQYLKSILEKIERYERFHEHIPLALQTHRPVGIPSHAPKYEENFNPDKKSYDPDRTRSEVNKMKAQLKKERKFTMKEIRKDTRFEGRQQIENKRKEQADYHSKMARIINQISTEEGMEKGKYEREKRLRNSKR